jgi:molybdopterin-guanine dinucleotide biosynthesis protein A
MFVLPQPTGTILAGGLSRRMFEAGGDKGLLDLAGRSMIAHVIERTASQVCALVVNANGDPARFSALGLPVVHDTMEGFVGPLAGVLAGLRWTAETHPFASHTLSVSADAPFVPLDLVAKLATAIFSPNAIALAKSDDGLHPVIGLWPVSLADDLERALRAGMRKVLDWTNRHTTRSVHFAPIQIGSSQIDPFFNANTPNEMARARAILDAKG